MKTKIPHLILAGLLGTSITSLADTVVWDGDTDNTWGAGTNWVGDPSPPTNGDDLTFSGTVQTSTSNDLAAGTDIAGIQFTNTTGGEKFTLAGNAIDLTGNITTTAPLANGDGILLDTISLNMQLTGGDRTFTTNQFDANDRHDITVSGVISEDASPRSLIKEGSSFLYLSGTNTYTGATTINAGRLYLGNGGTTGSLDTASTISIASGAALEIWQSDDVTQGTDFSGAAITGAGQLRKSGADGTLILNTANTYTGGTFINRSPVQIEHNDALGTGAVTLWQSNAKLKLVDGITLDNDMTIVNSGNAKFIELVSGSATISSSSTMTMQETSGINARFRALNSGTLTLDAQITGAGGIAANGGTVILTNAANNYTGQTYVTAGTLQINDGAAVSNTSSILLRGSNVVLSLADGVTVDRNLTAETTGVNKTLQVDNAGTTSATYSGGITIQETSLNAFDLDAGADDTLTISGVISGTGAAGVTKEGTGTAILTNTNTHTGNTTVSAGTLQISGGGSLSTSSAVVNNANLNYGTTIASDTYGLSSSTTGTGTLTGTAKLLQLNGDITQGTVNLTSGTSGSLYGQGIELVADTTITAGSITLTGDLGRRGKGGTLALDTSGTNGAINLDVSIGRSGDWYGFNSFTADAGTGTLIVSGANAGSGGWRGTSSVSLTGNLDISSSFSLSGTGAGKLDLTATGNSSVTGDLALANTTNTWTVNPSLTMDVSGAISGTNAAITKDGTGTLTLSGANTYSGNTTVSDGTLIINGNQSGATGAMTINANGTLAGSGTIGASLLTVNGVIAPGNSPGTLTTGAQLWNDGGSYLWEINASDIDGGGSIGTDPGWDWLDINGSLDLSLLSAGGFTIDIDSLTSGNIAGDAVGFDTWTKGAPGDFDYSFTIATFDSLIGTFDASLFTLDSSGFTNGPSWDWQIKLSGSDLVLEAYAVPEPSSAALLGLGGLALMLRRKRS
jgi:fibronectin-binding autotransporter adhesin